MDVLVSVIIPNRNGSATIEKCLAAVFSSRYTNFEVIVVDDNSDDNSIEVIKRFPCRLVRLDTHQGASRARNVGALQSRGGILFFTDSDCVLEEDTLSVASRSIREKGPDTIVGGTYTREPYDEGFFSIFQSVFINYSETKNRVNPDYIATHAMAVDAAAFRESGGFSEDFLPILEDVEFSHRLKRKGYKLAVIPGLLVRHIFNFSLFGSLRNAARKAMYWTMYSLKNRDLLADSGAASSELKANVASHFTCLSLLAVWLISREPFFLFALPALCALNLAVSRKLVRAFYETKGMLFAVSAVAYYTLLYPVAVGAGVVSGIIRYVMK